VLHAACPLVFCRTPLSMRGASTAARCKRKKRNAQMRAIKLHTSHASHVTHTKHLWKRSEPQNNYLLKRESCALWRHWTRVGTHHSSSLDRRSAHVARQAPRAPPFYTKNPAAGNDEEASHHSGLTYRHKLKSLCTHASPPRPTPFLPPSTFRQQKPREYR